MKRYLSALAILCATGAPLPIPVQAQPPGAVTSDASLATRMAIQAVTNDLNSALQRGDAQSALALLAPDFELGHRQYRKQDAAWMRQVLPKQLERTRFTELAVTISGVQLNGTEAVASGRIDVRASLKEGGRNPSISGDYAAVWVQTKSGWRLKRSDQTFNLLLQLSLPTMPPAVTRSLDALGNKATLPREEPFLVLEQSQQREVEPLVFSPDGATLASNGFIDGLRFSSARSGVFTKAIRTPMSINSMTYAPDGTLVTGHNDGHVRLWNVESGELKRELAVSRWSVYAVCVSSDGRTLAADGAGGSVQLWDMATGTKLRTLGQSEGNVRAIAFSRDNKTIAFETGDAVELWSVKEGLLTQSIKYEKLGVFLPDGKTIVTIASGSLHFRTLGGTIVVREVAIPNPLLKPLKPHPPLGEAAMANGMVYVPTAIVAPDGRIAASIYQDGSVGLWDVQSGTLRRLLRGFQSNVMGGDISSMAFAPEGESLAVGSRSGEIAVWKVLTSRLSPSNPQP